MASFLEWLGNTLDKLAYMIGPRLPGSKHYRPVVRVPSQRAPAEDEGGARARPPQAAEPSEHGDA